jgi:hypothetical protein
MYDQSEVEKYRILGTELPEPNCHFVAQKFQKRLIGIG